MFISYPLGITYIDIHSQTCVRNPNEGAEEEDGLMNLELRRGFVPLLRSDVGSPWWSGQQRSAVATWSVNIGRQRRGPRTWPLNIDRKRKMKKWKKQPMRRETVSPKFSKGFCKSKQAFPTLAFFESIRVCPSVSTLDFTVGQCFSEPTLQPRGHHHLQDGQCDVKTGADHCAPWCCILLNCVVKTFGFVFALIGATESL